MARLNSPFLALLLAAPLAFTSACTDSQAQTFNSSDRIVGENQDQPDDLNAQAKLLHVGPECDVEATSCARSIRVGDRTALKVQLLNAQAQPIENAFVSFELEHISGATGATLSALRAVTNSNGIASVDFASAEDNPAANMGTARVTASVDSFEEIDPVEFNLGISTKAGGAYIIKYSHNGEATPQQVITRTFNPSVTCAEIEDQYLTTGAPPPALVQLPPAIVHPNGDISPVIYPQIANGESFTLLGIARTEVGSQEVDVAYGCSDNNRAVENGQDVTIEIPLFDHLPFIGQTYSVDHAFNITDALPPAVQNIVQMIEVLATNPAVFILGDPSSNSYGLIDMLMDFDFLPENFASAIDSFRNNAALYGVALDFLNNALDGILPEWAKNTMVGAADITDMLQRFSVSGRMKFLEQPDLDLNGDQVVGILYEENNEQIWDTIIFRWSQGCEGQAPSCSNVRVNASGYTGDTSIIDGNFAARLQGATKLRIERHSLSIHYGALLLTAIEKVVLPRLFGDPSIDSLDAMVRHIIDCEGLVDSITGEGGGNLATALTTMCDQLLENATDALRSYITETLVADGSNHFQLETAPDNDCTLYQPTNYVGNVIAGVIGDDNWQGDPRPYIEKLGLNEAGKQCEWQTYIRFTAGTAPRVVGGTFHGTLSP